MISLLTSNKRIIINQLQREYKIIINQINQYILKEDLSKREYIDFKKLVRNKKELENKIERMQLDLFSYKVDIIGTLIISILYILFIIFIVY